MLLFPAYLRRLRLNVAKGCLTQAGKSLGLEIEGFNSEVKLSPHSAPEYPTSRTKSLSEVLYYSFERFC